MSKKELIMSTLEQKMGYCPEIDEDGDIKFAYQLKTIFVMTADDDEPYVSVMLPQFHDIEEGKETVALAVCNKMTRELKFAKVYIDQTFNHVTATCEFYYSSKKSLLQNLERSLELLGVIRTVFRNDMDELSEM
jgi:hypothetical protein